MVAFTTLVKSLLLASVANAAPAHQLDERMNYCVVSGNGDYGSNGGSGRSGTTVVNKVITTEVVIYQIIINTFIQQNTVLNYGGGCTIIVDNAPTQILTIGTGTSTATNTAVTTVMPAPGGGNINIFNEINIINFPVVISTFIQQNTIIQGAGGVNIVINNAPTFILTTATGTSTVTATVTSTVTSNNSAPTSFILQPVGAGAPAARKQRRQAQAPAFIGGNGATVDDCSQAEVFTITAGQLSGAGGYFVSTNNGTASGLFQTSQAIGDISTTFSVGDGLAWSNTAFSDGAARFCLTADSRVFTLFTANATVPDCVASRLLAIPAGSCNNGVIQSSSSSTLPATTSASATSTSATDASASSSASSASTSSSASDASVSSTSSAASSSSTASEASASSSASSSSASASASSASSASSTSSASSASTSSSASEASVSSTSSAASSSSTASESSASSSASDASVSSTSSAASSSSTASESSASSSASEASASSTSSAASSSSTASESSASSSASDASVSSTATSSSSSSSAPVTTFTSTSSSATSSTSSI